MDLILTLFIINNKYTHLLLKTLNKIGIERNFLKFVRVIYQNPIANIILNCERQKAFLLRSEISKGFK